MKGILRIPLVLWALFVALVDKLWPLILVIAVTGLTVLAVRSYDQGKELKSLIASRHEDQQKLNAAQAERSAKGALNRGINVERWCEGEGRQPENSSLNGSVRFNAQFVKRLSAGELSYALKPLPCEQFILETLENKIAVSKKDTPLVYKALEKLPSIATKAEVIKVARRAGYRGP